MKSYSLELFNLEGINTLFHEQAKEAARRGDITGIFICEDSNRSLYLLSKNVKWFSRHGLYEKALLEAWTNQKCVPPGFHRSMKNALLSANRKKLIRHSDPLPKGKEFVLYRGVQGNSLPRGISWTFSLDIARYFASQYPNSDGTVCGTIYSTVVKRSQVYAYVGDVTGRCGEKEALLVLPEDHPIEVFEEISVVESSQPRSSTG